ncbi:MAG: phage DNA encapsidation protein [Methanobrevibacter sp.]|nr:phage DNA encapsidation protein [Methanobrevibacter sp.]MBO7736151.1 phage DNA encapsidation protein [Methanobrevibacter sp.]
MKTKTWNKIIRKREMSLSEAKKLQKTLYENKEWYTIRSLLGHHDVNWYVLIGARERGKTFTVQDYVLNCFFNPKHRLYHVPFYWMRLNDIAIKNMTMNNGAKMFEPLLVRKYGLEGIKVKGDSIYINGLLLCRVYGLSNAYNNKGSALFDKDTFKGVNIIVDEVALEKGQRKTFDVVYNLKMQIENIVRSEREHVKVFFMLNNTEECPEAVAMFGFIPINFGVYKLKRKHCVIDYIPNNAAYEKRRSNALANEIDTGTGNFTNKIAKDLKLLYKGRLEKPKYIVKYSKDQGDWFTVWNNNVVCPYKGEKVNSISMKRYIDDVFIPEARDSVIEQEDVRAYKYKDILTQTLFRKNMELIKK